MLFSFGHGTEVPCAARCVCLCAYLYRCTEWKSRVCWRGRTHNWLRVDTLHRQHMCKLAHTCRGTGFMCDSTRGCVYIPVAKAAAVLCSWEMSANKIATTVSGSGSRQLAGSRHGLHPRLGLSGVTRAHTCQPLSSPAGTAV